MATLDLPGKEGCYGSDDGLTATEEEDYQSL